MAKLTLPIPSPVPPEVLGKNVLYSMGEFQGPKAYRGTRLAFACQHAGLEQFWMLATVSTATTSELRHLGPKTQELLKEFLASVGCFHDMFPELREVLEEVAVTCELEGSVYYPPICAVLMALRGYSDWSKEPAIIAALAEHGLRPGMPIEELFVYVPAVTEPTEPKKLTVAEELLAFGKKTVEELALKEQALGGLPPDPDPFISTGDLAFMLRGTATMTMIELMYFFATLPQQYWDRAPLARDSFLRWARMELSDEAFAGIMGVNR